MPPAHLSEALWALLVKACAEGGTHSCTLLGYKMLYPLDNGGGAFCDEGGVIGIVRSRHKYQNCYEYCEIGYFGAF
jgi:hypothetical protein